MIFGSENDIDGCHLAVSSVDVTFGHHFVATHLPSHPIGVLIVLDTPVTLSKMAGSSASYPLNSYPLNSWLIDTRNRNSYIIVTNFMQVSVSS